MASKSPNKTATKANSEDSGFSILEVVLAFTILAFFVAAAGKIFNSNVDGLNRGSLRSKLSSVVALRMEKIRHCAFFYLLDSSLVTPGSDCSEDIFNSSQQISYYSSTLISLCNSNSIGTGFSNYLASEGLAGNFNLQDYDPDSDSETIETTLVPDGNKLNVTLNSSSTPVSISSTIVPSAHGWCP